MLLQDPGTRRLSWVSFAQLEQSLCCFIFLLLVCVCAKPRHWIFSPNGWTVKHHRAPRCPVAVAPGAWLFPRVCPVRELGWQRVAWGTCEHDPLRLLRSGRACSALSEDGSRTSRAVGISFWKAALQACRQQCVGTLLRSIKPPLQALPMPGDRCALRSAPGSAFMSSSSRLAQSFSTVREERARLWEVMVMNGLGAALQRTWGC